jgi:hypothetical protein
MSVRPCYLDFIFNFLWIFRRIVSNTVGPSDSLSNVALQEKINVTRDCIGAVYDKAAQKAKS